MFQCNPSEYKTGQKIPSKIYKLEKGFCFLNFVDIATALKSTPSAFHIAAHNVDSCTTKIQNHRCELFFSIFPSANDVGYCMHKFVNAYWYYGYANTSSA